MGKGEGGRGEGVVEYGLVLERSIRFLWWGFSF